jgi:hypothetical protein
MGRHPGKSHFYFYNRTENKKGNKLRQGKSFIIVHSRESNGLLSQFSELCNLISNDHIHNN